MIRKFTPQTEKLSKKDMALIQARVPPELKALVSQQMELDKLMGHHVTWDALVYLMLLAYLKESGAEIPSHLDQEAS